MIKSRNWRPQFWDNPTPVVNYSSAAMPLSFVAREKQISFEEGGDLMLKCLREQPLSLTNEEVIAQCAKPYGDYYTLKIPTFFHIEGLGRKRQKLLKGRWVFIPNEEE